MHISVDGSFHQGDLNTLDVDLAGHSDHRSMYIMGEQDRYTWSSTWPVLYKESSLPSIEHARRGQPFPFILLSPAHQGISLVIVA